MFVMSQEHRLDCISVGLCQIRALLVLQKACTKMLQAGSSNLVKFQPVCLHEPLEPSSLLRFSPESAETLQLVLIS